MGSKKRKKIDREDNTKKGKKSRKHPKLILTIRIILLLFVMAIVVGAGVVVGMLYGTWGNEFEITEAELVINGNSVIVDSKGKVIAELSGDENRKIITFDKMPKNLVNAYISIEDERFYNHNGVDFKRTSAAIATYIFHRGSSSFGGSTITQQLVKNITQEDQDKGIEGVTRKVKEWAKAYQIERMLSKDQILELYLNIIFVGGGNYGVESGAKYYFNKSASKLSLAECAFLAGINNAPNSYNPFGDYSYKKDQNKKEKINNRAKTVLAKMLEQGYINQEDHDKACEKIDKGLKFKQTKTNKAVYSYLADATLTQVINDMMEEKKWTKEYASTYVYGGGLTIYSTQDSNVQKKMLNVMDKNSKTYQRTSRKTKGKNKKYEKSQSAMVVIDNKTGYVVGCVGGLGTKNTVRGLNRATQSPRQTGSAIKPLVDLLPGIEEGIINPATVYYDNKTIFSGAYTSGKYSPKNQSRYRGAINLRQAVTTSQNIPFVKVMAEVTPPVGREYLRKMGVTTLSDTQDNGLSLAIGGLFKGITPLEMAAAYATIANDGVYRTPLFYTKVVDHNGKNIIVAKQEKTNVCSKQTAYIIKNMLTSVVKDAGATAPYCAISGMDVAAKTGTTNSDYDRWLCGFTNYYSGATWYGFDQNEPVYYSGNPAGQIWSAIMKSLHKGKANSKFKKPDGIVSLKVCNATGLRASKKCKDTHYEIFVRGKEPDTCTETGSKGIDICKETGLIANEYCPEIETKYFASKAPKEAMKLWQTVGYSTKEKVPTKTCNVHNKDNTGTSDGKNNKPTIKLKGSSSITLTVGENYNEQGATASDNVDGDITSKLTISGSVNTSVAGTYTITYKVTNSRNITTTVVRTIIVKSKESSTNTTENETQTNNENTSN